VSRSAAPSGAAARSAAYPSVLLAPMVEFGRLLWLVGMTGFLVPLTAKLFSRRPLTRREGYVAMFGLVIAVTGFLLSGGHFRGPPSP
jgi:hypothetical protein